MPTEPIIHDGNFQDFIDGVVDGEHKARGLVPRNFALCPHASMPEALNFTLPLIPESEWDARYDEMVETDSFLSSMMLRGNQGQPIPSLDQGNKGYCWAHSTTGAILADRARSGQPYVPLSAYAVACIIKNFQDEGGWCGESLKFLVERGVPSAAFWAQQSMSRSNDKPATWENAALHKVSEGFYDLGAPIWDQKLTFQQMMTCLFLRIPCAIDLNWWGHSVLAADPVRIEAGSWGPRIRNSWGDGWGDKGFGLLQGSKGKPDNAVAIRVSGGAIA